MSFNPPDPGVSSRSWSKYRTQGSSERHASMCFPTNTLQRSTYGAFCSYIPKWRLQFQANWNIWNWWWWIFMKWANLRLVNTELDHDQQQTYNPEGSTVCRNCYQSGICRCKVGYAVLLNLEFEFFHWQAKYIQFKCFDWWKQHFKLKYFYV